MYLYMYIYLSMYIYLYVCIYIYYMYLCKSLNLRLYKVHPRIKVLLDSNTYIYVCIARVRACMYVCENLYVFIKVYALK